MQAPRRLWVALALLAGILAAGTLGYRFLVGGTLFVTRVGRDEPKKKGLDGAWLHSAEYTAAASAFIAPEQQPAQAAAAQAAAAQPNAAAELPYPPHLTPEQLAGLQAANVAPAVAWQMFPPPTS